MLDPDDDRTLARQFHDALKRKRLQQRKQLRAEAEAQAGPDDMHDDPDRENRILFDACDDIIREPDAIEGARELEALARAEDRRVHDDGDLEAVDDVAELERQDFEIR